jgi:hypothetical protein
MTIAIEPAALRRELLAAYVAGWRLGVDADDSVTPNPGSMLDNQSQDYANNVMTRLLSQRR